MLARQPGLLGGDGSRGVCIEFKTIRFWKGEQQQVGCSAVRRRVQRSGTGANSSFQQCAQSTPYVWPGHLASWQPWGSSETIVDG